MIVDSFFKKNIICWIISICAVIAFVLPMYFFTIWSVSDILLIPGVTYLGYLGLRMIVRFGTFDVFSYQFQNWVSSWKKDMPKKYQDAYEYKSHMKDKRENNKFVWIPWLVIGLICLILCLIFSFFPSIGR